MLLRYLNKTRAFFTQILIWGLMAQISLAYSASETALGMPVSETENSPALSAARMNQILETYALNTRLSENIPQGLAFSIIFLELAKENAAQEKVLGLAKDLQLDASSALELFKLAKEARLNAMILHVEGNAPDITPLKTEFADRQVDLISQGGEFFDDKDLIYLFAFLCLDFHFSEEQTEAYASLLQIQPESWKRQLDYSRRFMEKLSSYSAGAPALTPDAAQVPVEISGDMRSREITAAEETFAQMNLMVEAVRGEMVSLPADAAYLSAKAEETLALAEKIKTQAEGAANSTGAPEIDGIKARMRALAEDLRQRSLEIKNQAIAARPDLLPDTAETEPAAAAAENTSAEGEEKEVSRFYREVETALQELEEEFPKARQKSPAEIETYLNEIRAKKEDFLRRFQNLPNTTGSRMVIRLEENLTDMLEEYASFEVQLSERLRVMRLREKRVLDRERLLFEEFNRLFQSYRNRFADEALPVTVLAELRREAELSVTRINEDLEIINGREFRQQTEFLLGEFKTLIQEIELRRQNLLRKKEEERSDKILSDAQAETQAVFSAVEAREKDRPQVLKRLLENVRDLTENLRKASLAMENSYASSLVEANQQALGALLSQAEAIEQALRLEAEKLAAVENEEILAAEKSYAALRERFEAVNLQTDNAPDLESIPAQAEVLKAAGEEFISAGQGLANTAQSRQVLDLQRQILAMSEQVLDKAQWLVSEAERLRVLRDEALIQEFQGQTKREKERIEALRPELEYWDSRQLEIFTRQMKEKKKSLHEQARALPEVESREAQAVKQEISGHIRELEVYENLAQDLLRQNQKQEDARFRDEQAARELYRQIEEFADGLERNSGNLRSWNSLNIEALLAEAAEKSESFTAQNQQLNNETDSAYVRNLQSKNSILLEQVRAAAAGMEEVLQNALQREQIRRGEWQAAVTLRDRLSGQRQELLAGLPALNGKPSAEIAAYLERLAVVRAADQSDASRLSNSTDSPQIADMLAEIDSLLVEQASLENKITRLYESVLQFEAVRAKEETRARAYQEEITAALEEFENILNGLNQQSSQEAEAVLIEMDRQLAIFRKEYTSLQNSTSSLFVDSVLTAVPDWLSGMEVVMRKAEEILQSIQAFEKIRAEDMAAAARAVGEAERLLQSWEQNTALPEDAAGMRGWVNQMSAEKESLAKESSALRNRAEDAETASRILLVKGTVEKLNGILESWERQARELERKDAERQQEERAAEQLTGKIRSEVSRREKQGQALLSADVMTLQKAVEEIWQAGKNLEDEYLSLSDTYASPRVAENKTAAFDGLRQILALQQTWEQELRDTILRNKLRAAEEAKAKILKKEIRVELKKLQEEMKALDGSAGEPVRQFIARLDEASAAREPEVSLLQNSTGSAEIDRVIDDMQNALLLLQSLRQDAELLLNQAEETEKIRWEEEQAVVRVLESLEKILAAAEPYTAEISAWEAEKIKVFQDDLNAAAAEAAAQFQALRNTAGAVEFTRQAEAAGQKLAEVKDLQAAVAGIYSQVLEREKTRQMELSRAESFLQEARQALAEWQAEASGTADKDAAQIKGLSDSLSGLMKDLEQRLPLNTAEYAQTALRQEEAAAVFAELKTLEQALAASAAAAQAREEFRTQEEQNAAQIKNQIILSLGREKAALQRFSQAQDSAALRDLAEQMNGEIKDAEKIIAALPNTLASAKIAQDQVLLREKLQEWTALREQAQSAADSLLQGEAARQQEVTAALELEKNLSAALADLEERFSFLSGSPEAEWEEFTAAAEISFKDFLEKQQGLTNTAAVAEIEAATVSSTEKLEGIELLINKAKSLLQKTAAREKLLMDTEEKARDLAERITQEAALLGKDAAALDARSAENSAAFLDRVTLALSENEAAAAAFQGMAQTPAAEESLRQAVEQLNLEKALREQVKETLEAALRDEQIRKDAESVARTFARETAALEKYWKQQLAGLADMPLDILQPEAARLSDALADLESRGQSFQNQADLSAEAAAFIEKAGIAVNELRNLAQETDTVLRRLLEAAAAASEEEQRALALAEAVKGFADSAVADVENLTGEHSEIFKGMLTYLAEKRGEMEKDEALFTASSVGVRAAKGQIQNQIKRLEALEIRLQKKLEQALELENKRKEEEIAAQSQAETLAARWQDLKSQPLLSADSREQINGLEAFGADLNAGLQSMRSTTGSAAVEYYAQGLREIAAEYALFMEQARALLTQDEQAAALRAADEQQAAELLAGVTAGAAEIRSALDAITEENLEALAAARDDLAARILNYRQQYELTHNHNGSVSAEALKAKAAVLLIQLEDWEKELVRRIEIQEAVLAEKAQEEQLLSEQRAAVLEQMRQSGALLAAEFAQLNPQDTGALTQWLARVDGVKNEWNVLAGEDAELVREAAVLAAEADAFRAQAELALQSARESEQKNQLISSEKAAAESLYQQIDYVYQETMKFMPQAQGAEQEENSAFLAEISGLINDFSQQLSALHNSTAAEEVEASIQQGREALQKLADIEAELSESAAREDDTARPTKQAEKEIAALLETVQQENAWAQKQWENAAQMTPEELSRVTEKLRTTGDELSAEKDNLGAALGISGTAGAFAQISRELEAYREVFGKIEEKDREAARSEDAEKIEKKAAGRMRDRVTGDIKKLEGTMARLEKKDFPEIEAFVAGLRLRSASYEEEYNALSNKSRSVIVKNIQDEIMTALQRLSGYLGKAEEVLQQAQDRRVERRQTRHEAEALAKNILALAEEIKSRQPALARAAAEQIQDFLAPWEADYAEQAGRNQDLLSQDPAYLPLRENEKQLAEIRARLDEVTLLFQRILDMETRTRDEADRVSQLLEEMRQIKTQAESGIMGLSEANEEEKKVFIDALRWKIEDFSARFSGIENSLASEKIAEITDQAALCLEALEELEAEAVNMSALPAVPSGADAVSALRARSADTYAAFTRDLHALPEDDKEAVFKFISGLDQARGQLEAEKYSLPSEAGDEAARQDIGRAFAGLDELSRAAEERLLVLEEQGALAAEKEQMAAEEQAAAMAFLDLMTQAELELKDKVSLVYDLDFSVVISYAQAIDGVLAGFDRDFQTLTNNTQSPEVDELLALCQEKLEFLHELRAEMSAAE